MIPPFFGQWESAERIGDILSGALRAEDDPLWPRSGARDAAEYAEWADHLCGVACLRMALGARGIAPPRAFDLARELTTRGGYVVQPDGFIRGLIYAPAASWLAEAHGIAAEVRVDMPAEAIPALVAKGGMFVASVHPWVRWQEREPPSRGGHLVLVFAAAGDVLRFHNPSGHSPAAQADTRLPVADFARFYAGRGIWLPG
ncbi:C39 family peptidase [Neoroseomonas soli]|uniref:C39 family peptidase n=1 Tax=Neoroseomonas soli TaxID=1081025 RepID=UPI001FE976E4|nr:C39 family peptidase [Neoroseomonas soli]